MRKPIYIRPLTEAEREEVNAGLRSAEAFVLRRSQILLASARRQRVPSIAQSLGCDEQTVRNVIHAFNAAGKCVLTRQSKRPQRIYRAFEAEAVERLKGIVHQSPRVFGQPTSVWTLDLVADVSFAEGLTAKRVSGETVRATLQRLGIRWQRAKHWITSPDPGYARKKKRRDRLLRLTRVHPDWAVGFMDEVWWSRFALPALHAWAPAKRPLRLIEQSVAKDDPDRKALACYGTLMSCPAAPAALPEQVWLRFVQGRPVSALTIQFLEWICAKLQALGMAVWCLIWDNASWHLSHAVRTWIQTHNRQVKQNGQGVRILPCYLPVKSPWLNRIEPRWLHAKRRIVEPDRLLSAAEVEERVCARFGCGREPHLAIPENVA